MCFQRSVPPFQSCTSQNTIQHFLEIRRRKKIFIILYQYFIHQNDLEWPVSVSLEMCQMQRFPPFQSCTFRNTIQNFLEFCWFLKRNCCILHYYCYISIKIIFNWPKWPKMTFRKQLGFPQFLNISLKREALLQHGMNFEQKKSQSPTVMTTSNSTDGYSRNQKFKVVKAKKFPVSYG